jgi:hypothetical protein
MRPQQADERTVTRPFKATCVTIEEDADRWLVGFADAEFNATRYLLLQRLKAPEAEDISLGLDGYHVEVDDQSNSCYGGIRSFELFPDRAIVEFDRDAAAVFGDAGVMVVEFALRPKQLDQLRDGLARIFAGDECFFDRNG